MADFPAPPDLNDQMEDYATGCMRTLIDALREWRASLDPSTWDDQDAFGSYCDGIDDTINTAESAAGL